MKTHKLEVLNFSLDSKSSFLTSFNTPLLLWVVMVVLVVLYNQTVLNASFNNWEILSLPIVGLLLSAGIRVGLLIKPYSILVSIQSGINALLATLIVLQTHGLDSPFLPLLIFIPLLNQSPQRLVSSLLLSSFEIVALLISIFIQPSPLDGLFESFSKFALLGSGMLLLSHILDQNRTTFTKIAGKEQELLKEVSKLSTLSSETKQEEEDLLEGVLHNIKEGVLVTNSDGRIVLSSRKALETLKTSNAAINSKSITQVLPISDKQGNQTTNIKLNLSTLDAEPITVSVDIDPLVINNQVRGKIYVIKDITLESALEGMKLDFVATAAHQLRTPLTSLKGYLDLFTMSVFKRPNTLTEKERLYLARLKASSDRLHSLVENLLNVTKVERGMLKLNLTPLTIEEIIKDCLDSVAEEAKQKSVQLVLDKSITGNTQVMGDLHLLSTALTNLIVNGIEFNHPSGWVMISMRLDSQTLTLFVTDSGRGIPPEAFPHLFTKFYRANNTLTQSSNGVGLGLFIAKSIIEAHHGKIDVNSLEGKGTTFRITLPLATAQVHQIKDDFGSRLKF